MLVYDPQSRAAGDRLKTVEAAQAAGGDEVELATVVTYEDGRQSTIQSRVTIEDIEGAPARV